MSQNNFKSSNHVLFLIDILLNWFIHKIIEYVQQILALHLKSNMMSFFYVLLVLIRII